MRTLGIACGGGGSRALCHLGVLSVLEQEGLPVGALSGSSLGGLIAAMYAFDPDAQAVCARAREYFATSPHFRRYRRPTRDDGLRPGTSMRDALRQRFHTVGLFATLAVRPSLLRRNPAQRAAAELLPDRNLTDARLPLALNAVDLTEARLQVFTRGSVRKAVTAGTAVAVVFPPFEWDGHRYVDAAPVSAVPVRAARSLGADVVLAVDVRTPAPRQETFRTGFDVVSRLETTSSQRANDVEVREADILLTPDTGATFWGDFSAIDQTIAAGEHAAREALGAIRAALG